MKKIITIMLASMMVLSLCACGGTESMPDNSKSNGQAQEQTAGADDNQAADQTEAQELPAEAGAATDTSAVHTNDEGVYRVIVSDTGGDFVQGAAVQFCDDTSCRMAKTDENGVASFEAEKGVYTVHVLKIPEGYEPNADEYKTADTYCDICIVLQKK